MADLPKSVAELRETIQSLVDAKVPMKNGLDALDTLCALAAPNAKLREAARTALDYWTPQHDYSDYSRCALMRTDRPESTQCDCSAKEEVAAYARLSDALSAAPEAAKADEVVLESSDRAQTWRQNCEMFLACLERVADAADARFKCTWPDLHKFVAPRAKMEAEMAELRAKLEAVEGELKLADEEIAGLQVDARTAAREIEARGKEILQAVDQRTAAERDLAAARADQRAVAVEELKTVGEWTKRRKRFADAGVPDPACVGSANAFTEVAVRVDKRIAALTAPAAEPQHPVDGKCKLPHACISTTGYTADGWHGHCLHGCYEPWGKQPTAAPAAEPATIDIGSYTAGVMKGAALPVPAFEGDPKDCAFGLADYVRWANEARGTPQFIHRAADVAMLLAGRALGGK